eukprot:2286387-Rhodomonas_salina.2
MSSRNKGTGAWHHERKKGMNEREENGGCLHVRCLRCRRGVRAATRRSPSRSHLQRNTAPHHTQHTWRSHTCNGIPLHSKLARMRQDPNASDFNRACVLSAKISSALLQSTTNSRRPTPKQSRLRPDACRDPPGAQSLERSTSFRVNGFSYRLPAVQTAVTPRNHALFLPDHPGVPHPHARSSTALFPSRGSCSRAFRACFERV